MKASADFQTPSKKMDDAMTFRDRADAGKRLGQAVKERIPETGGHRIVMGIPRGGVEVAAHVAKALDTPLSMVVARKLPYPDNPEAGFGAVAEDGSNFLFDYAGDVLLEKQIEEIIQEQVKEMRRRKQVLRAGKPLPTLGGRHVVLVDDGIAMGSTMRAAITLCRNQDATRITAAAPVAGPDVACEIAALVDDLVVLTTPSDFHAVAQVYERWYDVTDQEVIGIMEVFTP